MPTMAPTRRVRLSEHVVEQIIVFIREQSLRTGDLLPTESEFMGRLGVGRSSVREALRGLALLGVVEIRQGQGTFVKTPTPPTDWGGSNVGIISGVLARGLTDDLLEAREIIEVRMASLAAQRATAEDLVELERLVADARRSAADGRPAFHLGAEFHRGVARAAHNDVLEGFVASYIALLTERGAVLERLPGYGAWEIQAHDTIRLAIAAHDARLAATRMREHLKDMTVYFEHLAATSPQLDAVYRRGGPLPLREDTDHG